MQSIYHVPVYFICYPPVLYLSLSLLHVLTIINPFLTPGYIPLIEDSIVSSPLKKQTNK